MLGKFFDIASHIQCKHEIMMYNEVIDVCEKLKEEARSNDYEYEIDMLDEQIFNIKTRLAMTKEYKNFLENELGLKNDNEKEDPVMKTGMYASDRVFDGVRKRSPEQSQKDRERIKRVMKKD